MPFSDASPQTSFLVADIGPNCSGSADRALRLIDGAAECGCDAVNFHRYPSPSSPHWETLSRAMKACPDLGSTPREVARRLDLGEQVFKRLREATRGKLIFWGTAYDQEAIAFLGALDVDSFYVPPGCNTDFTLLEALRPWGKPIYISTGSCDAREIAEIVQILEGCDVILMHGIAAFPVPVEETRLHLLEWMGKFGCPVGYDDREAGILTGPVAASLGAKFIQKKVTLDRSLPGQDHAYSADLVTLRQWVRNIRLIERAASGPSDRQVFPIELEAFDEERRCIIAATEIPKGTPITREMLATGAPLRGLTTRLIPDLIGRQALYHIQKGEPITFGLVEMQ